MKFNEKYPQHVKPATLMGPHETVWVTETLEQSWRAGYCIKCNAPTSWRTIGEGYCTAVCSEECLTRFDSEIEEVPEEVPVVHVDEVKSS